MLHASKLFRMEVFPLLLQVQFPTKKKIEWNLKNNTEVFRNIKINCSFHLHIYVFSAMAGCNSDQTLYYKHIENCTTAFLIGY